MAKHSLRADSVSVTIANRRPDTIDGTPLLKKIEAHIVACGTSPTVFGRRAVNDPCLVFDMRRGRWLTRRTASRIESYLAKGA
ncbi:hypothetical protein FHS51_003161 [Sphingobium wenxiniae]|uniref:Uncharacterized protein n=1 Tax=Sphingobium wenxiniae (strain DSM 21828 / CGMCC 1.7748 / JZ-1) TaxID=595605 RepID=A0A562KIW0_SPHWJ|nr:hypothetical protein [Sphingobium wenxiniae]TWH95284.1 hypothetical protein IQ35_01540 [Sphingobium wenxiniae]